MLLGERLAESRRRAGMTQTELAVALGKRYNAPMISMVEHGKRGLLLEGAVNAARELDVSLDYLAGLTDDPAPSWAGARSGKGATRPVAVVEIAAAAGAGMCVDEEEVAGHVWFRRAWLDQHGLDPAQCCLMGVRGESMEPTLPDGCSILVNRQARMREDRLFVVRTEDGLIVKRLGKNAAGAWRLISDHPDRRAWPAVPWPAGAAVFGEAIWMARDLSHHDKGGGP